MVHISLSYSICFSFWHQILSSYPLFERLFLGGMEVQLLETVLQLRIFKWINSKGILYEGNQAVKIEHKPHWFLRWKISHRNTEVSIPLLMNYTNHTIQYFRERKDYQFLRRKYHYCCFPTLKITNHNFCSLLFVLCLFIYFIFGDRCFDNWYSL